MWYLLFGILCLIVVTYANIFYKQNILLFQALVKEMNRLGIVIDLSEASYKTQLDVLSVTKAPVIFSHTAAYTLTSDNRNIKDDVLEQLVSKKHLNIL